MKPDDSTITPQEYLRIRREAEKALREGGGLGRFPTPVDDILAAHKLAVADVALDAGILRRFRMKAKAAIKRAMEKVLGLLHAHEGLIFIDRTVRAVKQSFLKLHEGGHAILPWQRRMYAVTEDGELNLEHEIADQFEREANVFATEVMFQLDGFLTEARDDPFGIKVPLRVGKKYGASAYAAIREYVRKNERACAVVALNAPEVVPSDGLRATLRRVVPSPKFRAEFGDPNWPDAFTPDDEIGACIPVGQKKMSAPRTITIVDAGGGEHACVAEAFRTPFNVFILIHARSTLGRAA